MQRQEAATAAATAGKQGANNLPFELDSYKIMTDGDGRASAAELVLAVGQHAFSSDSGSVIMQIVRRLNAAADQMGLTVPEFSVLSSPGKQDARVKLCLRLGTGGVPPVDPQAAAAEPSGTPGAELTIELLLQFVMSL